jgi:hypothetical protein
MGRLKQSTDYLRLHTKVGGWSIQHGYDIYRNGVPVGMYNKLHIQTHNQKYTPVKHLNVHGPNF